MFLPARLENFNIHIAFSRVLRSALQSKADLFLPNESFFKLNFYCYSITVVCLFSPSLHSTTAKPTSLPYLHPTPGFCPCVLYSSVWEPFSPLSLPLSPLAIVTLLTSMSLVIFCVLFLLLIMFQLKVRSYGICPSPPGLIHLA